ncbi:MAG: hypothetical protein JG765_1275 [Cereibacter sp.]|jgi:hypothetical protein|nr:hypothetical protein [Cereibacter sp.]
MGRISAGSWNVCRNPGRRLPEGRNTPIFGTGETDMRIVAQTGVDRWLKPAEPDERPEDGHEAWLQAEIAEGLAELDAGKAIPAAQLWKDLGLE